jgi:hypothetical protein
MGSLVAFAWSNKNSKVGGARNMYSRRFLGLIFTCVVAGSLAVAQAPIPEAFAVTGGAKAGMVTMHVDDVDVEPVKGIPFCTTVTTEHTQAFADGNRIHTSDSSTVCRDGEGRTRHEASLNLLGASAQRPAPKLITIVDPVAGYRYMLDSESKTAHRMPIGPLANPASTKGEFGGPPEKGQHVMLYQRVGTGGPTMVTGGDMVFKAAGRPPDEPAATTEKLGDQTIDGIRTTGTRMTTTIPAGRMGNEHPMQVTSERWYSPELRATLMTKHSDPWAGELKTQFTNVNTSEPDASLFQVPSDYKIVDDKAAPFLLQKRILPPPPVQ